MLGLRTSIGRTNGQLRIDQRWLDSHDFMAVEKYTFPPNVSKQPTCMSTMFCKKTCILITSFCFQNGREDHGMEMDPKHPLIA